MTRSQSSSKNIQWKIPKKKKKRVSFIVHAVLSGVMTPPATLPAHDSSVCPAEPRCTRVPRHHPVHTQRPSQGANRQQHHSARIQGTLVWLNNGPKVSHVAFVAVDYVLFYRVAIVDLLLCLFIN